MNEQLIPKFNFEQLNTEALKQLKQLKDINDELQTYDADNYQEIKQTLKEENEKFTEFVQDLQPILLAMEKKAIGSEQKRKVKAVKDGCTKEINRNKVIAQDLTKQGYNNRRQTIMQSMARSNHQNEDNTQQQQEYIGTEQLEVDNMLIKEQQEDLNEIESQATKLQGVVNQLAQQVDQQDVQLNIIQDNENKALDNVKGAGNELSAAQIEQKKTQRKLFWILIIALIIAACVGVGLYFAFT